MITSLENEKIKKVIKLKQKKYRDKEDKFIIETLNLVKEALKLGILESVYTTDDLDIDFDYELVSVDVMRKMSSLESVNVLAVCKKIKNKGLFGSRFLLLDNIQDPGNLGTIIRTSLGFNIDTVVLSNTSVDLYNEKVIRASEGAIFSLNIIRSDLEDVICKLKDLGITIITTDVREGVNIRNITYYDNFALIMGNEGQGVSKSIKEYADCKVNIKTSGKIESLNVAVATGIILYELGEKDEK